jgi:hypothetical protein
MGGKETLPSPAIEHRLHIFPSMDNLCCSHSLISSLDAQSNVLGLEGTGEGRGSRRRERVIFFRRIAAELEVASP